MNSRWPQILLTLLTAINSLQAGEEAQKPNILLILADDLGFSDLGSYGGEIQTPNLDRLADNGLRYSQFYNTARCCATRAALMTGYYAQQVRRDSLPGVPKTGGRGERPDWAPLLPRRLARFGYRSYHIGKWHIDGMPVEQGFDRSYYLKDQGRFFNPQAHWLDDKALPPVAKGGDFYATTELADRAIAFLEQHAATHGGRPFFQYLAFAAPHFPLHAPAADIAAYDGVYEPGWDAIRARRFEKIAQLGFLKKTALSAPERDLGPPYAFPKAIQQLGPGEVNLPLPWEKLDPVQAAFQAKKMAIHAAMIHRMDKEIGRVLAQIKKMGALDNTMVIFLSDNGASAEIMVRSDGHDPQAPAGSAATYLCLGPGWSTTCNTPFRRHKTWTHEGGIATPMIISWPASIKARGEWRHSPGHVVDLVPTILGQIPALSEKHKPPSPTPAGKDISATFAADVRVDRDSMWWFHDGHRAIRAGDWKLVAAKDSAWELYDLSVDRAESNDQAAAKPELVRELESKWQAQLNSAKRLAAAK